MAPLRFGRVLFSLRVGFCLTLACGGQVASEAVPDAATEHGAIGDSSSGDTDLSDATADAGSAAEDSGLEAGPVTVPDGGLLAHCQTGGNVLFVEGDPGEITHPGPLTFGPDAGSWSAPFVDQNGAEVDLWPNDMTWGDGWAVYLDAPQGMTLNVQRYDNAVGIFTQDASAPTLYVMGGWVQCATTIGWFEIEQYTILPPGDLQAITATFEQYCNGETAALHGCLHFQQP
jgi:hypothetical protein